VLKFFKRLTFLFQIHKSIPFIFGFIRSKEVKVSNKVFLIIGAIAYMYFPLDIIFDYIPFLGIVDDAAVLVFLLNWMVKVAPDSLKQKYLEEEKTDKKYIDKWK
jgi:uncharacterized membrane protein YkvA (DUF1232 family)